MSSKHVELTQFLDGLLHGPKVDAKYMEKIRKRCCLMNRVNVSAEGSSSRLCLAWNDKPIISLRSFSQCHINVDICDSEIDIKWRFMGFYGRPIPNIKRKLGNYYRA